MKYSHRKLKQARAEVRLDIRAAARQAGMARKHLEMLEAGVSIPRADTLAKIAQAYGKPIDFFFVVRTEQQKAS